ncbi:MAG: hypothetical protein ACK4UO_06275 [Pseudolabrys sp.]
MTIRFYAKRVGFSTPSTGNTGDLAIGSRLGPSFKVPSETTIANTNRPLLLVQEGDDYMIVDTTFNSAAGGSFTIDAVLESMIAGTLGTTRMTLAGAAEIRFLPPDEIDLAKLFVRADIDQASILNDAGRALARANIAAERLGVARGNRTETDSFTFVLTDAGKMVFGNKASAMTATIPPNASVAFPVDTYLNLGQKGAGEVAFVAGAGVTIRTFAGLKLAGQHAAASALKVDTDEWWLFGALTA